METFRYSWYPVEKYRAAREAEGWERWKTEVEEWNLVWLLFGNKHSFDEMPPEVCETIVETVKDDMERNGHWLRALMKLPSQDAADYLLKHPKRWKAVRALQYFEQESLRFRLEYTDGFSLAHPLDLDEDPLCEKYFPEEVYEVERIAGEALSKAAGAK